MQKYSKISLLIFLTFAFFIPLCIFMTMYIIDPLQIWHKSFFNPNTYSYTIRESAKAFIRDYDFDSVIFGNSHTENTSAKKTSEILGGKFMNLSMSGSSLNEKYILLQYLLKKKNIKQIVFLFDSCYQKVTVNDASSFEFLYDDNPYNDIKIYLNNKYFLCSMGLQQKSKCSIQDNLNIDYPYRWEDMEIYKRRFGGFNKWLENYDDEQISGAFKALLDTPDAITSKKPDEEYHTKLKEYLDKYLLNIINDNPNIKFYIIISPVSDLRLAQILRDENLLYAKSELLLEMLTDFQTKHKNMEVYAFDNLPFIGKIENYKDLDHYKSETNYYILNSIANKKNQITVNNRESYLKSVYDKSKSINYGYYINLIKRSKYKQ